MYAILRGRITLLVDIVRPGMKKWKVVIKTILKTRVYTEKNISMKAQFNKIKV